MAQLIVSAVVATGATLLLYIVGVDLRNAIVAYYIVATTTFLGMLTMNMKGKKQSATSK